MPYRMRYRKARKRKPNMLGTIILIILILFISFNWVLPTLVNGLGSLNRLFKPVKQGEQTPLSTLAPPVLLIPYEATNSAKVDISGYATSHSTVNIYLDEVLAAQIETGEDGSFIARNFSLKLGTNNIYGKTVDQKDQESLSSKTLKVIFDNEKPELEVTEPEDGKTSQDRKIKVSGKTEPGATLYINDQRTIMSDDGSFASEITLNEGENTLTIKVHDGAGNLTEIQRKVNYQP